MPAVEKRPHASPERYPSVKSLGARCQRRECGDWTTLDGIRRAKKPPSRLKNYLLIDGGCGVPLLITEREGMDVESELSFRWEHIAQRRSKQGDRVANRNRIDMVILECLCNPKIIDYSPGRVIKLLRRKGVHDYGTRVRVEHVRGTR
jgi:hypothetical protein